MFRLYAGKGLAGLVAVIITIATVSFPTLNMDTAAVWFFMVATIYVLPFVTTIMYKFIMSPKIQNAEAKDKVQDEEVSTIETLKSGWLICLTAFLIRFTTFTIYPALVTNIQVYKPDEKSLWNAKYFQPISIFLPHAIGDLIGKMMPKSIEIPKPKHLTVCALLRLLLIPLILMCNIQPRTWPVWFKNEAFPAVFVFVAGITEGWFLNRAIMYAPDYVDGTVKKGKIGELVYCAYVLGMGVSVPTIFAFSALIRV